MATFDDLSTCLEQFSGKARLFPLPNLVLFPHIMQPLHIFEQRYRDLLEDAVANDSLIAMAALAPGWEEDYDGCPAMYPMACLGRVVTHCRLEDGTYNVLLLGVKRVRLLQEYLPSVPFRQAHVQICEDVYSTCSLSRKRALYHELRDALLRSLPAMPEAREQLDQLLGIETPMGILTDLIGYMFKLNLRRKQRLLAEVDVYQRAELLLSYAAQPGPKAADVAGLTYSDYPTAFSRN